jgi:hypothetical protein
MTETLLSRLLSLLTSRSVIIVVSFTFSVRSTSLRAVTFLITDAMAHDSTCCVTALRWLSLAKMVRIDKVFQRFASAVTPRGGCHPVQLTEDSCPRHHHKKQHQWGRGVSLFLLSLDKKNWWKTRTKETVTPLIMGRFATVDRCNSGVMLPWQRYATALQAGLTLPCTGHWCDNSWVIHWNTSHSIGSTSQ